MLGEDESLKVTSQLTLLMQIKRVDSKFQIKLINIRFPTGGNMYFIYTNQVSSSGRVDFM